LLYTIKGSWKEFERFQLYKEIMEGLKRIKKDINFSLAVVEEKKRNNLG
jgi:hypothetical protein